MNQTSFELQNDIYYKKHTLTKCQAKENKNTHVVEKKCRDMFLTEMVFYYLNGRFLKFKIKV